MARFDGGPDVLDDDERFDVDHGFYVLEEFCEGGDEVRFGRGQDADGGFVELEN